MITIFCDILSICYSYNTDTRIIIIILILNNEHTVAVLDLHIHVTMYKEKVYKADIKQTITINRILHMVIASITRDIYNHVYRKMCTKRIMQT